MDVVYSFGEWVSQRRKMLDLTQRELAAQAACAVATIKKIESDQRRPSRDLAEMLAGALRVPTDWQETFVECARGQRAVDALATMPSGYDDQAVGGAVAINISLPVGKTTFVGRGDELDRVAALLYEPDCRLLTVTGPGGIGKTRLAMEAAHANKQHFEDGAAFVPLAPVSDAQHIPATIASSLNLPLNNPSQLLTYLNDKNLLLVLDNCEQFGTGLEWLSDLLASAPHIKLLATSRERLRLAEEWVYALPELDKMRATELFVQTARRVKLDFDLDGQEQAVHSICQLVEHLPLAIELAASWVPLMPCDQIADHIQRDIDFLEANMRNVPERHLSLRAVFDHSWQLLSHAEQDALMRLSVFRGGWTVDEAEPVAGAILSLLRDLMDKSLVRNLGDGRFDLHEVTRQYAAEKLRESGEEYNTQSRHAETYIDLLNLLMEHYIPGPDAIAGYVRLETELDNFRAVLAWAIENDQAEVALHLLSGLFFFWLRRGYWLEGERWSKAALAAWGEEDNRWAAIALINLATYVAIQGRYADAYPYIYRGREMAYRLQDTQAMLTAAETLMEAAYDIDEVTKHFEQAVSLLKTWDHAGRTARLAGNYTRYGDRLRDAGHYTEAKRYFHMGLEDLRKIGNIEMIAYPVGNLGRLALREGRLQEAYDLISESVATSRRVGNRVGIADWVWQLGHVSLHLGDTMQAENCFEEALALYEEIGNRRALPDMLSFLGHAALLQDDFERATSFFDQSLSAYQEIFLAMQELREDWSSHFMTAFIGCLMGVAVIAAKQHAYEYVVTLLSFVEQATAQDEYPLEATLQHRADVAFKQAQTHLPESEYAAAWEAGKNMPVDDLLAYGLKR